MGRVDSPVAVEIAVVDLTQQLEDVAFGMGRDAVRIDQRGSLRLARACYRVNVREVVVVKVKIAVQGMRLYLHDCAKHGLTVQDRLREEESLEVIPFKGRSKVCFARHVFSCLGVHNSNQRCLQVGEVIGWQVASQVCDFLSTLAGVL